MIAIICGNHITRQNRKHPIHTDEIYYRKRVWLTYLLLFTKLHTGIVKLKRYVTVRSQSIMILFLFCFFVLYYLYYTILLYYTICICIIFLYYFICTFILLCIILLYTTFVLYYI